MSMAQYEEQQLWGLGIVAGVIHWLEELLGTLNGIVLMIGASIAVVDLLTSGALSQVSVLFVFGWAISQAIGLEVNLLGSFARARQAQRHGSTGAMLGWLTLGAILLGVTVIAGYTYGIVREQGISTEDALTQLGISNFAFLGVRASLAAGLVALSGWTRYQGKPKLLRSTEDEVAAIERQMKIDAARAKYNRQKATQKVKFAKAAVNAAFSRDEVEDEQEADAGPKDQAGASSDTAGEVPDTGATTRSQSSQGKRIFTISEARKFRQAKEAGSPQSRVFAFLEKHPAAPLSQIMAATGVGKATASKYRREHQSVPQAQ